MLGNVIVFPSNPTPDQIERGRELIKKGKWKATYWRVLDELEIKSKRRRVKKAS